MYSLSGGASAARPAARGAWSGGGLAPTRDDERESMLMHRGLVRDLEADAVCKFSTFLWLT